MVSGFLSSSGKKLRLTPSTGKCGARTASFRFEGSICRAARRPAVRRDKDCAHMGARCLRKGPGPMEKARTYE